MASPTHPFGGGQISPPGQPSSKRPPHDHVLAALLFSLFLIFIFTIRTYRSIRFGHTETPDGHLIHTSNYDRKVCPLTPKTGSSGDSFCSFSVPSGPDEKKKPSPTGCAVEVSEGVKRRLTLITFCPGGVSSGKVGMEFMALAHTKSTRKPDDTNDWRRWLVPVRIFFF